MLFLSFELRLISPHVGGVELSVKSRAPLSDGERGRDTEGELGFKEKDLWYFITCGDNKVIPSSPYFFCVTYSWTGVLRQEVKIRGILASLDGQRSGNALRDEDDDAKPSSHVQRISQKSLWRGKGR